MHLIMSLLSSLGKGHDPSLEQRWIPFTQSCFNMPILGWLTWPSGSGALGKGQAFYSKKQFLSQKRRICNNGIFGWNLLVGSGADGF